jgi:hypothetical protein
VISALGVSGEFSSVSILSRIYSAFKKSPPAEFKRWSAEELAQKKNYLEGKNPEDYTREDHYLAAEWVIQRYLPEGEEPSSERWKEVQEDIRRKIDRNIEIKSSGASSSAGANEVPHNPEFQKILEEILSK